MSGPTNTGFGDNGIAPSTFISLRSPGSGFMVDTTARTGKKKRRGRKSGRNSSGPSTPTTTESLSVASPLSLSASATEFKRNNNNSVTAVRQTPVSDSGSVKKKNEKKKNRRNRDRDIQALQNKVVQRLNNVHKLKGINQSRPTSAPSGNSMNQFDALQSLTANIASLESEGSTTADHAAPNAAAEESASEEYEPEYIDPSASTGTAEYSGTQSSEEDIYDPSDFVPVKRGGKQPSTIINGELPANDDTEFQTLRQVESIVSISSEPRAVESIPNSVVTAEGDNANQSVEDHGFIAFDFSDEDRNDEVTSDKGDAEDAKGDDMDGKHGKRSILAKIAGALKIDNKRGKKRKREEEDISVIAPWTVGHNYSHEPEVTTWLHKEVQDFIDFVSPDDEQVERRASTVDRVQKCVKSLWSDATVCVFGSYATNLYLPDSDIDIVIVSDSGQYDNRSSLYQLANALKSAKIAINVEVIAKARVPIIKFTDRISMVNVDISFERYGGVVAANTILHWVAARPGLRELVMIIKYFLAKRDLNSVPNGGLGGFAVVCMVLSFFQMHPKIASGEILPEENLGVLLIQFLELYGKNFNYDVVGISVTGNGSYFDKNRDNVLENRNRYSLAIRDPNDPTNNISRGTYNLRNIRRAFGGAYDILTTQCYEMDALSRRKWVGKSLLGSILYIEERVRMSYRDF
ncbi:hypothetical protein V1520DRAFT_341158 [Lipomyces starkeyi]|uniref:polynucleotide adenylyltransferase n=1 Tax=Lipomyces starkeyi NRRL Y-11557 TaxID=675824 RepID=A0A1E3PYC2_LIPST|nr:hypothetical protein LIPSTDRAFT_74743 [Lipomyces starkeyi NRRL Y-11557]